MTRVDFFVSYTTSDRAWAEWVAWQLKEAGYSVTLQAWDFRPGMDFLHEMQRATTSARRTIAILSPGYLASEFGEAEWRTIFARDPTGERGLLVPVRVREFDPPGLLGTRVYIDLVDRNAADAAEALLRGVSERGARPRTEPPFPGAPSTPAARPWFPGSGSSDRLRPLDRDWSVPTGFIPIWLGLEEAPRALPRGIAIDPGEFASLNDLLDALFIGYLHRVVSAYSYGAEWVLLTGWDVVAAPARWVWDPTQPIRRIAPAWAASLTLEEVGLRHGAPAGIHRPSALDPYAVVTDNPRLGRIVKDNPKAMAILWRHLSVVGDDSYRDRAIQLVLCDWMRRELAGKILQDTDLTSEKLDELSSAYLLEPWRLD
jgi:TIR domain